MGALSRWGRTVPTLSLRSIIVLVLIGLVVFVGPWLVTLYTDWLWFGEVGYEQVFLRTCRPAPRSAASCSCSRFAVLYAEFAAGADERSSAASSPS